VNLATIQDINNYTWDGRALPTGSYVTTVITGSADKATSVAVTVRVPSASITTTKKALFTVNNIRDNAGNTLASAGAGEVTFVSGNQNQPEFNYAAISNNGASLALGFSEAVQSSTLDAYDFDITLNGYLLATNSIASVYSPNSNVDTFVVSIKASVANDISMNRGISDVIYLDTNNNGVYDEARDIVLDVVDYRTHSSNAINSVTANLNSNYITSLRVKLVRDTVSPVQNAQGNYAIFNKEIDVRLR